MIETDENTPTQSSEAEPAPKYADGHPWFRPEPRVERPSIVGPVLAVVGLVVVGGVVAGLVSGVSDVVHAWVVRRAGGAS